MGAVYVLVVLVIVALVVAGLLLARLGRHSVAQHEEVTTSSRDLLRYDVPAGQDPAAVLVALSRGGFEAVADPGNPHVLTVVLPLGPQQREEVRVILENEAEQTLDPQDHHVPGGRVRFADER